MRDNAYVGNIYFCQVVRQQASQTCGCCGNSWLIDNHASFQQQTSDLYTRNISKAVVLIQLSKMGLMIAWQTHCLKMLRFLVEEFINDQSNNMVRSKHQSVVATLFPVFATCSSIVTAPNTIPLRCAAALRNP